MSRTSAREYALKVLYSRELNPESEPIEEDTLHLEEKDKAFADALIEAAAHEDVDDKIKAYLKRTGRSRSSMWWIRIFSVWLSLSFIIPGKTARIRRSLSMKR